MKRTALIAALFLLASCGHHDPAAMQTPAAPGNGTQNDATRSLVATYDSINANIFQPKCYKCHTGSQPAGDLDLSDYPSLLKADDIVSGNPEASNLYNDVKSGKMPRKAAPLSGDEVQVIYNWIKAGLPKS